VPARSEHRPPGAGALFGLAVAPFGSGVYYVDDAVNTLRALDAYREPVRLFGLVPVAAGTAQTLRYSVIQRTLLWLPLVALLATLAYQSTSTPPDIGDLDAQLLTQELPPDAFLDKDFRSWVDGSRS